MSTFYKFKRPTTVEKLVEAASLLGWKLSKMADGTLALEKTSYVEINKKNESQVSGFTCYGANECDTLLNLTKLPIDFDKSG